MQTKVQKWGNSLALRIPKAFALESKLQHDSTVDISMVKGKIVVTPVESPEFSLELLLSGINKNNIHSETDTGDATGKEIW